MIDIECHYVDNTYMYETKRNEFNERKMEMKTKNRIMSEWHEWRHWRYLQHDALNDCHVEYAPSIFVRICQFVYETYIARTICKYRGHNWESVDDDYDSTCVRCGLDHADCPPI